MSNSLTISIAQPSTLSTSAETLSLLHRTAQRARARNADLLLLPEAFLGGYPRGCSFGAAVGSRDDIGREQFLKCWNEAVDLGDTPQGEDDWCTPDYMRTEGRGKGRGDGSRERLEEIARETGVFLVTGAVERSGGSLYCTAIYVCPNNGCIGKRRKLMPTGTERLIWAQGDPKTLKAVVADIKGTKVTLAAAICWENYMPLLRYSLYSQNVNLWLAPTADARDTWLSLMRTIALEGRCFVLSSCMCVEKIKVRDWIREPEKIKNGEKSVDKQTNGIISNGNTGSRGRRRSTITKTEDNHEVCWPTPETTQSDSQPIMRRGSSVAVQTGPHEIRLPIASPSASTSSAVGNVDPFAKGPIEEDEGPTGPPPEGWVCRGGSCIIGPGGNVISGPLWEDSDGMIVETIDFEECIKGKLDFDAAGSYSRRDAFELKVRGLDLSPPV